MTDTNGFWAQAAAEPDRTVLTRPRRRTVEARAGCTPEATGSSTDCASAGMRTGDSFAVVLPNGVEFLTAYLAASQVRFLPRPGQHHPSVPRSPGSSPTARQGAHRAHERFSEAATAAAGEAGLPVSHRYAVGTVAGFRPYEDLLAPHPRHAARRPHPSAGS
ncbi:hypothetical protein ACFSNO_06520 [Streptomyces cirratus]